VFETFTEYIEEMILYLKEYKITTVAIEYAIARRVLPTFGKIAGIKYIDSFIRQILLTQFSIKTEKIKVLLKLKSIGLFAVISVAFQPLESISTS